MTTIRSTNSKFPFKGSSRTQRTNTISVFDKLDHWVRTNRNSAYLLCVIILFFVFIGSFFTIGSIISSYHNQYHHNTMAQSTSVDDSKISDENNNFNDPFIKRLKILLMSDIHYNNEVNDKKNNELNIQLVYQTINKNKIEFDQIWIPGDLVTIKDDKRTDNQHLKDESQKCFDLLSQINKLFNKKPIVIPGNHDPDSMFTKLGNKNNNDNNGFDWNKVCINIHNQIITIPEIDNLWIAGFGGSIPAYQNNQIKWAGYPYNNEQEYEKDFKPFLDYLKNYINNENNKIKNKKNSLILFTHNGPNDCSTTIDWRDQKVGSQIYMGSDTVRNSLLDESIRDYILVNIHGHTHKGYGQGWVGETPVINPGSLKKGQTEFALLTLAQDKNKEWHIESYDIKHIWPQFS